MCEFSELNEAPRRRASGSFIEGNFPTYSVEFLKSYQAVCSEIDVVGKMMAMQVNPTFNSDDRQNNIYKWWYEIQNSYSFTEQYSNAVKTDNSIEKKKLQDVKCTFIDAYTLCPWSDFKVEAYIAKNNTHRFRLVNGFSVPFWWSDYNKVKHYRTSSINDDSSKINYSKANLKNVSYAFSALYVLKIAFMEAVGTQNDLEAFADYSKLFYKISNITTEDIDKMFGA